MKTESIHYYHERCPRMSEIEWRLSDAHGYHSDGVGNQDKNYRRFAKSFMASDDPEHTHGMAANHPLRHALPPAWNLDTKGIQALNKILPGIIYECPRIVSHLQGLSLIAFRDVDPLQANTARTALKSIACPVGADTDHPARTPHIAKVMNLILSDFMLVQALYHREVYDEGVTPKEAVSAIKRTLRDIPTAWIDKLCRPGARAVTLAADRLGELTGMKGRGLYEKWKAVNGGDGTTEAIKNEAKSKASTITLQY